MSKNMPSADAVHIVQTTNRTAKHYDITMRSPIEALLRLMSAVSFSTRSMSQTSKVLYVYSDIGSGQKSIEQLERTFSAMPGFQVLHLTAENLHEGSWTKNADVLIMPGGADLQYAAKLNGKGNKIIRRYVESGGKYVGICAGAYYGSKFCDFHRGDQRPGYEVLGDRELSFFDGAAVGPVVGTYDYNSSSGARAVLISRNLSTNDNVYMSYVNGGCYFPDAATTPNTTVLYYYSNINESEEDQAAIIDIKVGNGRAILSGPHFEYSNFMVRDIQGSCPNGLQVDTKTNEELCSEIIHRLFM